ncbi:MAG: ATP-dependent zinc protease [Thiotrichales bacterium]|nr:ATP-dependent zinc protease [Thiotrichales bacterium]
MRCHFSKSVSISLTLLFLLLLPLYGMAGSDNPGKVIAGWVEKVSLIGHPNILKAKLDSGAKTSSIHAENVELFKRDGERWVRFKLLLTDKKGNTKRLAMEKVRERRVKIKEHDGNHDSRPVVKIDICFDGRSYSVEFTLADRSEFIYPVLLGRRFLAGIAVIDPEATFLTQAQCK